MSTKRKTRKKLYEGKAKILYEGTEPGTLIQYFKDDATAFNGEKHAIINGKGILNNRISELVMERLADVGIPTHFIKTLNMREQLIRRADIIPVEVVIRNFAAGSLVKRLGLEHGSRLPKTLVEYYYKDDKLGDPHISEDHIYTFGWSDPMEIDEMRHWALRVNDFLFGMFAGIGIQLVDFKIEFGRLTSEEGATQIILADEISPDSCRLWDRKTQKILDKDRFRQDIGGIVEAYHEVAARLGVLADQKVEAQKVTTLNASAPTLNTTETDNTEESAS